MKLGEGNQKFLQRIEDEYIRKDKETIPKCIIIQNFGIEENKRSLEKVYFVRHNVTQDKAGILFTMLNNIKEHIEDYFVTVILFTYEQSTVGYKKESQTHKEDKENFELLGVSSFLHKILKYDPQWENRVDIHHREKDNQLRFPAGHSNAMKGFKEIRNNCDDDEIPRVNMKASSTKVLEKEANSSEIKTKTKFVYIQIQGVKSLLCSTNNIIYDWYSNIQLHLCVDILIERVQEYVRMIMLYQSLQNKNIEGQDLKNRNMLEHQKDSNEQDIIQKHLIIHTSDNQSFKGFSHQMFKLRDNTLNILVRGVGISIKQNDSLVHNVEKTENDFCLETERNEHDHMPTCTFNEENSYFSSMRALIIVISCYLQKGSHEGENLLTKIKIFMKISNDFTEHQKKPDQKYILTTKYCTKNIFFHNLLSNNNSSDDDVQANDFEIANKHTFLKLNPQNIFDLYFYLYNYVQLKMVYNFDIFFTDIKNCITKKLIINIEYNKKEIPSRGSFKNEMNRLITYTEYKGNKLLDILKLTKNGLFLKDNFIICAFCEFKKKLESSTDTDALIQSHKDMHSDCVIFTDKAEGNITLESFFDFTWEVHRLLSFDLATLPNDIDTKKLAESGFRWSGSLDATRCAFCTIEVLGWSQNDNIEEQHKELSPQCSMFDASLTDGINFKENRPETIILVRKLENILNMYPQHKEDILRLLLGKENNADVIMGISAHPTLSTITARLEKFETWPISLSQTPQQLSEAGFFYSGRGDRVICFHCGGGLKDWARTDKPWIEHAAWFPHCQYLIAKKGTYFIERVQRAMAQNQSRANLDVERTDGKFIRQLTEIPTINAQRMAGFQQTSLRAGQGFVCLSCNKEAVGAILLPCAHLAACQECALRLVAKKENCPSCGTLCRAKFKVFLG